jgi:hypothetical protein
MKHTKLIPIAAFLLYLWTSTAQAQCSPQEILAFSRAATTCRQILPNTHCHATGSARLSLFEGNERSAVAGDRTNLNSLESIVQTSEDTMPAIGILSARLSLPPSAGNLPYLYLLGDITITNKTPFLPVVDVTTRANANARALPGTSAEIIRQLPVNSTYTADARSADNRWVRVFLPAAQQLAWLSVDGIVQNSRIASLPVRATNERHENPFERVEVNIGAESYCGQNVPSGMFVIAPLDETPTITLNAIPLQIGGVLFITGTSDRIDLYSLYGESRATIESALHRIPAGAVLHLQTGEPLIADIEPWDSAFIAALPINFLPTRVSVAPAINEEQLAALLAPVVPTVTPAVQANPTATAPTCRYTVVRSTTARFGPAQFYESPGDVARGTVVTPLAQTLDPDGRTWVRLRDNTWLQLSDIAIEGSCPPLEAALNIPAPRNNTLVMETCRTTNGPLRNRQSVTIEFNPPAFDSYAAALQAPQIDPGRIFINGNLLYARAGSPVVFSSAGQQKYAVRFSTLWQASTGVFRIEADRLDYEITCQVTVFASD